MIDRELASIPAFVGSFLGREGAATEVGADGAVVALLPPELQEALALPEVVTLRLFGDLRPDEVPFTLETQGMTWCLGHAVGQGRLAAAWLAAPRPKLERLTQTVLQRFVALNGKVTAVAARPRRLAVVVLEFEFEATSEERATGRVAIAVEPALGVVSVPLADRLLPLLDEAEPRTLSLAPADIERAARRVAPLAESLIAQETIAFRDQLTQRMAKERDRLIEYHDTLLAEARRRRGRASADQEAIRAKTEAIVRQRDHKLAELAARFATTVRCTLASAIEVTYEASFCELVVRRRKREIPICIPWDPFLHDVLALACPACGMPTLSVHVCDDAGHLTCADCAAPCAECSRVSCRSCCGAACPKCAARRGGP